MTPEAFADAVRKCIEINGAAFVSDLLGVAPSTLKQYAKGNVRPMKRTMIAMHLKLLHNTPDPMVLR